jgi:hypothetical protein
MFHHVERTMQRVWTLLLTHTVVIPGTVLIVYQVIWLVSGPFKPLNETFISSLCFLWAALCLLGNRVNPHPRFLYRFPVLPHRGHSTVRN